MEGNNLGKLTRSAHQLFDSAAQNTSCSVMSPSAFNSPMLLDKDVTGFVFLNLWSYELQHFQLWLTSRSDIPAEQGRTELTHNTTFLIQTNPFLSQRLRMKNIRFFFSLTPSLGKKEVFWFTVEFALFAHHIIFKQKPERTII